jgi:23S rRNA pseudouridine1911/1915/1917 synthase
MVKVVKPGTPQSKEAILEYEVLDQAQGFCLAKINLLTGRSHQIRVQMSNNGTPLVGDVKYGYKEDRGVPLALWSHQLEIEHPVQKERMLFTSSPPTCYPWNLFDM